METLLQTGLCDAGAAGDYRVHARSRIMVAERAGPIPGGRNFHACELAVDTARCDADESTPDGYPAGGCRAAEPRADYPVESTAFGAHHARRTGDHRVPGGAESLRGANLKPADIDRFRTLRYDDSPA